MYLLVLQLPSSWQLALAANHCQLPTIHFGMVRLIPGSEASFRPRRTVRPGNFVLNNFAL